MTDKEAMKLALFALDIVKIHYTQSRHINEAITALKERLADPMREVQRLGQEIEQEPVQFKCTVVDDAHPNGIPLEQWAEPQRTEQGPVCPDCKAKVLYECVACSSNNYPPKGTT